ncbi:hypothetical protein [Micromonospora sp. NBC_01796]|nr:hypothetical protein [Micromonospora sp. NBC_01796]WSA83913.1 hypothetical protein OIE47_26565 [Micromonospora sp. NBC_01796]
MRYIDASPMFVRELTKVLHLRHTVVRLVVISRTTLSSMTE